jgi:hypothetical protein
MARVGTLDFCSPELSADKGQAAVIDLLGMVVFATIVCIGLLDMSSGISPFAMYRSPTVSGVYLRAAVTERRGDGNQPKPPAPAR